MDNKILEIFIPGPAGRLEAKYYKSKKNTSPIALVLQPHPQYGGTMNNKVVTTLMKAFDLCGAATLRFNFRGVGQSEGTFDNAVGECDDLRVMIAWVKEQHPQLPIWLGGFSFGAISKTLAGSERVISRRLDRLCAGRNGFRRLQYVLLYRGAPYNSN